jgi:GTP-binding protein Era
MESQESPKQIFKSGYVAIIGEPNVGKSTLLNRLLGFKMAIVSDKPQTTRNRIMGVLTAESYQMILMDTPGIHQPRNLMGEYMMKTVRKTLEEIDLILYIVDAEKELGREGGREEVKNTLSNIVFARGKVAPPLFLVINKVDAVKKEPILGLIDIFDRILAEKIPDKRYEIIPVSTLEGDNIDELIEEVVKYLPAGPKYYPDDTLTEHPERFIIGEIIREKVFQLTHAEIPYSSAVEVEEVKEREGKNLTYVRGVIYIEKESQKPIVIGGAGKMLKLIGERARPEIESLLGTRVYLELWVKVRKNWRKDDYALKELGYV